jgi:putative N6-adenine-specific DNA methylase
MVPAGRPPRSVARAVAPAAAGRWFAAAAPGLEAIVAAEVAAVSGASDVVAVPGGVEFSGDLLAGMVANRSLRVATRVLRRLGQIETREFAKLRRQAAKLDWAGHVDGARPVRFEVTARSSRLYHTGAVAEALAQAIGDALGRPITLAAAAGAEPDDDGAADAQALPQKIFARGERDRWTISVDASGPLLHRRGWRTEAGPAPLRETLAAGLLRLAGYDPARPLVDLMCGSGTIVIEAAAIAQGRAPGAGRRFACEAWPGFDRGTQAAWAAQLAADVVAAPAGPRPAEIIGLDADAGVLDVAGRNAARAGLATAVSFQQAEVGGVAVVAVPVGPGLVVVNPPYGRRLGGPGQAARLVRVIGHELRRRFPGWRAGILLADPNWVRGLGLPVVATHALQNGGLRVSYVIADVPAR